MVFSFKYIYFYLLSSLLRIVPGISFYNSKICFHAKGSVFIAGGKSVDNYIENIRSLDGLKFSVNYAALLDIDFDYLIIEPHWGIKHWCSEVAKKYKKSSCQQPIIILKSYYSPRKLILLFYTLFLFWRFKIKISVLPEITDYDSFLYLKDKNFIILDHSNTLNYIFSLSFACSFDSIIFYGFDFSQHYSSKINNTVSNLVNLVPKAQVINKLNRHISFLKKVYGYNIDYKFK